VDKEVSMEIRDAVAADIEGIAAIYNHAVAHTTAIWNDQVVDVANRAAWHADRLRQGYPVLVAADAAGTVLGYATFGDWRPHDGYRHTVSIRSTCGSMRAAGASARR
jgi:Sortase and related acyltransferases